MASGRQRKGLLLVGLLIVMINLPLLQSLAATRALARDGRDVQAELVDHQVSGSGAHARYLLVARLPASVADNDDLVVQGNVDKPTYDQAVVTGSARVRVLPSRPDTNFRFAGEPPSPRVGTWVTLAADGLLALIVIWAWRARRRPGVDQLRMEATGDLVEAVAAVGSARSSLASYDDGTGDVTGQLVAADDHEALLDLGDRQVLVLLDGHRCSVELGRMAQARGRWLD